MRCRVLNGLEVETNAGQVWYVDVLSACHVPVVLVIRCGSSVSRAEMQRPEVPCEVVLMRQAHDVEEVGQATSKSGQCLYKAGTTLMEREGLAGSM